jgi:transcriptional regulator with XRE-family HTH domain
METTIRNARKAAHLSQTQLAEAIGVSQAYVSFMENGLRPQSTRVCEAMAVALGMPLSELFPN